MKQIVLSLGVLVCLGATKITIGQETEGVITYEIKINVHRTLPESRQHMKSMIPEFRTHVAQLIFNAHESLFKPVEILTPEPEDRNGMQVRFRDPKTVVYTHPGHLRKIMQKEFMGKKYLIEDSLRMHPWRLLPETKEVNGYTCRKATLIDEEKRTVVAWYAEGLRPFLGPEEFNTLPGAVIFVDINDGERTITATNIVLRHLLEDEIKIPDARNKVTVEEYRAIVKEQTDRMRANGGYMRFRN
jgi:GLPGLI family protein